MQPKKCAFLILILLSFNTYAQNNILERVSLSPVLGYGKDMETREKESERPYLIYIPSYINSPILRIQRPLRYGLALGYELNENLSLISGYRRTTRQLRYWSHTERSINRKTGNCALCTLEVKIIRNSIPIGLQFKSAPKQKVSLNFEFGLDFTWSPKSKFYISPDHKQAELITINDTETTLLGVITTVGTDGSAFVGMLAFTEFSISYSIRNNLSLNFGLRYEDDLVPVGYIVFYEWDTDLNKHTGAYSPYGLEFQSIHSVFGITYSLGKAND